MKLLLSFIVFAIAGIFSPAAMAGQQGEDMGQKARPEPVMIMQPDYILKSCEETVSGVTAVIRARSFSPAATLAEYLGNKNNRDILGNPTAFASIKTILLEDTKHGKMTTQTDDAGLTYYYVYTAIPNYEGKDKAIFMAEFEGKRYKIVLELHVFAIAPMENQSVYSCPPLNSSRSTANLCLAQLAMTRAPFQKLGVRSCLLPRKPTSREARLLIEKHGYWRRKEELEDAERVILRKL